MKNQDTEPIQITEEMVKRAVRASNEEQRRLMEKANDTEPEKSPFITLDGESLIQCGSCGEIRKVKETHTCPPKNQDTPKCDCGFELDPSIDHESECSVWKGLYQDTQPEGMEERFDRKFIPISVKHNKHEIDVQGLGIPMVPREVKAFIREEIAAGERRAYERVLTKIEEYRCHPDEVHCTCMNALKDEVLNSITNEE